MRIVDRATFLALPPGTIAAKYEPCFFGEVFIKWDTCGNDFVMQDLTGQFEGWADSGSHFAELCALEADQTRESPPLDYDSAGRDGLFDEGQFFAVWSEQDAANLAALFEKAARERNSNGKRDGKITPK